MLPPCGRITCNRLLTCPGAILFPDSTSHPPSSLWKSDAFRVRREHLVMFIKATFIQTRGEVKGVQTLLYRGALPLLSSSVRRLPFTHIPPTSGCFWLSSKLEKLGDGGGGGATSRKKQAEMQLCVQQGGGNFRKAKTRKTARMKQEATAMDGKTS